MLEPGVRSSKLVRSVFTLSLFKHVISTALYYTHHLELNTNNSLLLSKAFIAATVLASDTFAIKSSDSSTVSQ